MSFATQSVSSSGERTTTSQITVIGGFLHGFELNPPNSGFATLKIYDSNSAGTTKLVSTATCAAGLNSIYLVFPNPRACNSGIYAVLTNTSGSTTYSIGFSLG